MSDGALMQHKQHDSLNNHLSSFLYILAPNATSPQIDVLSVGNAPGQAKSLQTLDIGAALTKNKTKFGTDLISLCLSLDSRDHDPLSDSYSVISYILSAKVNMQGMAVFVPTAHQ